MIVLDFHAKEWHVLGWGPGLYPIFPSKGRQFFLGGYRKHPVECVTHAVYDCSSVGSDGAHRAWADNGR
eukprot:7890758-Pyramimonas_sp.AAC.1